MERWSRGEAKDVRTRISGSVTYATISKLTLTVAFGYTKLLVPSIWCLMDACIPRITPTAAANGVPSVAAVPSGVTGLVVVAAESADTKLPCWSMILQQMLLFCYKISTPQPSPILRFWAGVFRFLDWSLRVVSIFCYLFL